MKTIVLQTFKTENIPEWIEYCMASVKSWALSNEYSYKRLGDEFFDYVPEWVNQVHGRKFYPRTDIARLLMIKEYLIAYERVIWVDADEFIFKPEAIILPEKYDYLFSLEFYKGMASINNSFLMFTRKAENTLDHYIRVALAKFRTLGIITRSGIGGDMIKSLEIPKYCITFNGLMNKDTILALQQNNVQILTDYSNTSMFEQFMFNVSLSLNHDPIVVLSALNNIYRTGGRMFHPKIFGVPVITYDSTFLHFGQR